MTRARLRALTRSDLVFGLDLVAVEMTQACLRALTHSIAIDKLSTVISVEMM